jgi:hypothetical protein
MKSLALIYLVLLGLAACAHGPIGSLPKVSSPDEAVDVTIIRDSSLAGSAISFLIILDGRDIFWIRVGDYTRFNLDPGRHSIGVGWAGGVSPNCIEGKLNMSFNPRSKYFFLVSPAVILGEACAKIEQLSEQQGLERVSNSTYIPMTR